MLQTQRDSAAVQKKMADVNTQIADLTKTAAKDSASISAITILSAIYVPGSFVGVGSDMFRSSPLAIPNSIRPSLGQTSSNLATMTIYK